MTVVVGITPLGLLTLRSIGLVEFKADTYRLVRYSSKGEHIHHQLKRARQFASGNGPFGPYYYVGACLVDPLGYYRV